MNNGDNIVYELIGENYDYDMVRAMDNHKGHGSNLSVKIVLPTFCQANCPFCFNNLTKETRKRDYSMFLENVSKSLDMITNNITERGISLNITGNEPTFNMFLLMKFMNNLKLYKDKVKRIIISSNGFRLYDCIEYMDSVVDIVNISTHHYDYHERKKIFGTSSIPSDEEIRKIINGLKESNISATAVAVLYKDVGNFMKFYEKYTNWAKDLGFKNVRMRSNFCSDDKFIDDYLNITFDNQQVDILGGLTTKIIDDNGFETKILKGVPDLTDYVLGAELVIDDDGKCYIDYNKRYPVNEDNIKYFNNFYVLNKGKTRVLKK